MDNIIVINIWNRNTWRCSSFIFRCTRSRIIQILSCCSAGACSKQNRLIACRASFSLIRSNRLWFFYYFQNIISKKLTFLALNEICTTSSTPIQFFSWFGSWRVCLAWRREKNGNTLSAHSCYQNKPLYSA